MITLLNNTSIKLRILFFSISIVFFLSACEKAEKMQFDHEANLYFYFGDDPADSVLYTFAYEPAKASDTVFLPVKVSGDRVDVDRSFSMAIRTDSTTATEKVHYEPLKPSYILPAGKGIVYVPFIIYNSDDRLKEKSVSVYLKLIDTQDFGTEIPRLNRAKVVISSKLEQPEWWNMWGLTPYSQVKHELFIVVTGRTYLSMQGLDAPMNTYFTGLLSTMLNDPFNWVNKNPQKGYVLEKVNDNMYHFYNQANAARKIVIRKNLQSGKFFFIDETGREVI